MRTAESGLKARKPVIVRIWRRLDVRGADECWEWQGGRDADGYGRIAGNGPTLAVHRVMFEQVWGSSSGDICHSCDNPPCANPRHLWEGNASLNALDSVRKGRSRWQRMGVYMYSTSCPTDG